MRSRLSTSPELSPPVPVLVVYTPADWDRGFG
jgi:hypothetical protein